MPEAPVPSIDHCHLVDLLARLIRTPSINPVFDAGSPGEGAIAEVVAAECRDLGMTVRRSEPEPGRISVIGHLAGSGGGRSLMLYGHYDTVGVTGMMEPFSAAVRDGRMYGRGGYDMKGGLAACLAAVRAIRAADVARAGDLVVVGVADEEAASIGMTDVLRLVRTDAAIVTEPTEEELCIAHKGFCWIEVETIGRAAHGSMVAEGIDANMRMGRVLARLDRLERDLRVAAPHPLLGPPSLHAGVLRGGSGPSIYAASCTLQLEWRMLPHETEASVVGAVQAILDDLSREDPTFRATVRATLTRPSFEVPVTEPIVAATQRAVRGVLGVDRAPIGIPFWMDAALLTAAGIPTVVFGARGAGAHADEEWVDLASVGRVAEVLARVAVDFCG